MQCQSEGDCAQLAKLLPPTEAALLDWAINLMADVVQEEQTNKMNARNVAMVFAPNMTQVLHPIFALLSAAVFMAFELNLFFLFFWRICSFRLIFFFFPGPSIYVELPAWSVVSFRFHHLNYKSVTNHQEYLAKSKEKAMPLVHKSSTKLVTCLLVVHFTVLIKTDDMYT